MRLLPQQSLFDAVQVLRQTLSSYYGLGVRKRNQVRAGPACSEGKLCRCHATVVRYLSLKCPLSFNRIKFKHHEYLRVPKKPCHRHVSVAMPTPFPSVFIVSYGRSWIRLMVTRSMWIATSFAALVAVLRTLMFLRRSWVSTSE